MFDVAERNVFLKVAGIPAAKLSPTGENAQATVHHSDRRRRKIAPMIDGRPCKVAFDLPDEDQQEGACGMAQRARH